MARKKIQISNLREVDSSNGGSKYYIPKVGDKVICTSKEYDLPRTELTVARIEKDYDGEGSPAVCFKEDDSDFWILYVHEFTIVAIKPPPLTKEEKATAVKFPSHKALAEFLGI